MKKYRKFNHGHSLFTITLNKNEISGKKPFQGSEEPL